MGRKNRFAPPGFSYHVVNRGNDRKTIFHQQAEYAAFMGMLAAKARTFDVHVYGYCLMPNHFHLLVEPLVEDALSEFMQRLTCGYACYFRRVTDTVGYGHVVQRRFWSCPAQDETAFLSILRYIEANPVRAACVPTADLWPWSSFTERRSGGRRILTPLPVMLPDEWPLLVNAPQPAEVLEQIRKDLVPSPGRPRKEPVPQG